MRHLSLLLAPSLLASAATAQWTSSAAANTLAVARAGEQAQPKLVPATDGGFYLSWFDNDPNGTPAFGYDVYLQRFDSAGVAQWATDGILVADLGLSSTTDYDLALDTAGHALLVFQDDRPGGLQITLARVDPSGTLAWSQTLTSTLDFVANPKVVGTSDGAIVAAWLQGSSVRVQRFNLAGVAQWTPELVLTPLTGSYAPGDLDAAESGRVILSLVHQTGGFSSPRHLKAQKLETSGASLWGAAPLAVFDGGSLQFGNFPEFEPDGAGGAVFAWYSSSPTLECFAQRVNAAGSELFPHNGVAVSTLAGRVRVDPHVSFDPLTQATHVAWVEANSTQSQWGVGAQKLDATGARQWGASGKTLVALGTPATANVTTLGFGANLCVTWTSAPFFSSTTAHATVLDAAGATLVAPFAVSSSAAVKYDFVPAVSSFGFGALAWRDERGSDPHLYLQNVLPSGALGGLATTASRNGNGTNVVCYTSLAPARLGHTWSAQVSHAHHPGATHTTVFARANALNGPTFAFGQLLIAGPLLFSQTLPATGSANVHTLPVPPNLAYLGLTAATQALIAGGGNELTNALDVTAGL